MSPKIDGCNDPRKYAIFWQSMESFCYQWTIILDTESYDFLNDVFFFDRQLRVSEFVRWFLLGTYNHKYLAGVTVLHTMHIWVWTQLTSTISFPPSVLFCDWVAEKGVKISCWPINGVLWFVLRFLPWFVWICAAVAARPVTDTVFTLYYIPAYTCAWIDFCSRP